MVEKIWIYLSIISTVLCLVFTANTQVEFVYHADYEELFTNFTKLYPSITYMYSIGKSVEGRNLSVLAMSGNSPQKHVIGIPEVKYIGNIHGDEVIGRELLIHFAGELLSEYSNNNKEVKRFLDNTRVHILPTMNPDGFAQAYINSWGNCTTTRDKYSGRQNSNSYDLNRNFPDYFVENKEEEQPETQATMNWLDSIPFYLSGTLHGGALVVNYPFDGLPPERREEDPGQYSESPDDDVYRNLSLLYSYTHPNMANRSVNKCGKNNDSNGNSEFGFEDGITNGADWYSVIGSILDYNYFSAGCLDISFSVSCCKFPPEDQIETYYEENRDALLLYLQNVHKGIRGIVSDESSLPIENAFVEILNRESNFFRTSKDGEYWRILLPGEYQVQVSKDGYQSETKTVTVPDNGLYNNVEIDFVLETTTCTSSRLIPPILQVVFLLFLLIC